MQNRSRISIRFGALKPKEIQNDISPDLHYSRLYLILQTTRHSTHTHASSTIHLLVKRPCSQISFWANVFLGRCPSEQISSGQMSFWSNLLLGKRPSGQMSSGQMSIWANVFLGKRLLVKRLMGKCPSGQTSFWANVFWADVLWANVVLVSGRPNRVFAEPNHRFLPNRPNRTEPNHPFIAHLYISLYFTCCGYIIFYFNFNIDSCSWHIRAFFAFSIIACFVQLLGDPHGNTAKMRVKS
jgi:hypothetical protein